MRDSKTDILRSSAITFSSIIQKILKLSHELATIMEECNYYSSSSEKMQYRIHLGCFRIQIDE